jgi:hypothetical protein
LKLGRAARKQLAEAIAGATSLQGDFFRSVAFRYFHPDDVISGEGTRLHGGRFVPIGVRAVYASLEEETALREVTTRKNALGGRSLISVGEYPRMTFAIVPKYWRPSADHAWGSVVGSDSFPTCRSRRQAFRSRCSRLTF